MAGGSSKGRPIIWIEQTVGHRVGWSIAMLANIAWIAPACCGLRQQTAEANDEANVSHPKKCVGMPQLKKINTLPDAIGWKLIYQILNGDDCA